MNTKELIAGDPQLKSLTAEVSPTEYIFTFSKEKVNSFHISRLNPSFPIGRK
jgi:hypothetical protein